MSIIPLEKETLACVQEMPQEMRCSVEKSMVDYLFHSTAAFAKNTQSHPWVNNKSSFANKECYNVYST